MLDELELHFVDVLSGLQHRKWLGVRIVQDGATFRLYDRRSAHGEAVEWRDLWGDEDDSEILEQLDEVQPIACCAGR